MYKQELFLCTNIVILISLSFDFLCDFDIAWVNLYYFSNMRIMLLKDPILVIELDICVYLIVAVMMYNKMPIFGALHLD